MTSLRKTPDTLSTKRIVSTMATAAAYVGATLTLLVTACLSTLTVWEIVTGQPTIAPVTTGTMSLLTSIVVVGHDWPEVWKPLFTGDKR